jgi:hypothetical protein
MTLEAVEGNYPEAIQRAMRAFVNEQAAVSPVKVEDEKAAMKKAHQYVEAALKMRQLMDRQLAGKPVATRLSPMWRRNPYEYDATTEMLRIARQSIRHAKGEWGEGSKPMALFLIAQATEYAYLLAENWTRQVKDRIAERAPATGGIYHENPKQRRGYHAAGGAIFYTLEWFAEVGGERRGADFFVTRDGRVLGRTSKGTLHKRKRDRGIPVKVHPGGPFDVRHLRRRVTQRAAELAPVTAAKLKRMVVTVAPDPSIHGFETPTYGELFENPAPRLKDIATVRIAGKKTKERGPYGAKAEYEAVKNGADFYVQRRGSNHRLGRPHRTFNPHDFAIRIKDKYREAFTPAWLYWNMYELWRSGYWRKYGHGTLLLQNITAQNVRDLDLSRMIYMPLGMMDTPRPADPLQNPDDVGMQRLRQLESKFTHQVHAAVMAKSAGDRAGAAKRFEEAAKTLDYAIALGKKMDETEPAVLALLLNLNLMKKHVQDQVRICKEWGIVKRKKNPDRPDVENFADIAMQGITEARDLAVAGQHGPATMMIDQIHLETLRFLAPLEEQHRTGTSVYKFPPDLTPLHQIIHQCTLARRLISQQAGRQHNPVGSTEAWAVIERARTAHVEARRLRRRGHYGAAKEILQNAIAEVRHLRMNIYPGVVGERLLLDTQNALEGLLAQTP